MIQTPLNELESIPPRQRATWPQSLRSWSRIIQLLVIIAIVAVLTAYLMPVIQRAREQANLLRCKDNLRKVGLALAHYARSNGGVLPVSRTVENPHREMIVALETAGDIADPKAFYCPSVIQSNPVYSNESFKAGNIGYYYYCAAEASPNQGLSKFLRTGLSWPHTIDAASPPNSWVISDIWVSAIPTNHGGYKKGVNYLMLDGSVDFLSESPRKSFH